MKRAIVVLLVGLTALVGVAIPARAEGAPPPAGHCKGQYLSYIDCISAGLRWVSASETTRGGGRVRCEIPSNYRIVCFNFTPYVVRVRVNIFTTNGLYVRYIRIPHAEGRLLAGLHQPDHLAVVVGMTETLIDNERKGS